jgi:Family of unknown function (DUF5338)
MVNSKNSGTKLPDKGRCKIEFLAARDAIKTQLDEGWPAKSIWSGMTEKGAFSGGYRNFIKLVNSVILHVDSVKTVDHQETMPASPVFKPVQKTTTASPVEPTKQPAKTEKEPKKITAFEPANTERLGSKDAKRIRDDLI